MYNLNDFAKECDEAIEHNDIPEIDFKINEANSLKNKRKSVLHHAYLEFILGNLFSAKTKIEKKN